MKVSEVLEGIEKLEQNTAHNSMGCSENWYNFFFAMKETFTEQEIRNMNEREVTYLERLAANIQEGLY